MQTHFYVAQSGETKGPFSVEQIIEQVRAKTLDLVDYCYDEKQEDWIELGKHPVIGEQVLEAVNNTLSGVKTTNPEEMENTVVEKTIVEQQKAVSDPADFEWYVLKGESKFGPFAYRDIVRMLQEKSIFEFDYVWNQNLTTWKRVAELSEFSPESIRDLKDSGSEEISEIFFRRRHVRVGFLSSIIVHDNRHVWKGKSIEVSAGGAGLVIENAMLQPGQTLYLHFKPADGLPPFNAVCEVVSKQYMKGVKDKKTPIRYGVKFTSINTQAQRNLHDFTSKRSDAQNDAKAA